MMDGPALEARGVTKRYGSRDALCGVDLVARPGEVHGLLGPNGAGKTTLMRVVLGLVQRDAGTVQVLGRDLHSTAGPIPSGVAGLVETPAFYPYLSGRDNLGLLARLDGVRKSGDRLHRVLAQTGLEPHADVDVSAYSAGMRQRLGLAAALLRAPRLLVLDEPTSALDPGSARDVRALARTIADEGAAVVLSSHDMAEVEGLCSNLTVIDRGRVVFSGAVDELRRTTGILHRLHTSDDGAALQLASGSPGLRATAVAGGGLEVSADRDALDAYVIGLGAAGVAVRALQSSGRSLESLFLELTGYNGARPS